MWWYCASFAVILSVKGSSMLLIYGSIKDKCTEKNIGKLFYWNVMIVREKKKLMVYFN